MYHKSFCLAIVRLRRVAALINIVELDLADEAQFHLDSYLRKIAPHFGLTLWTIEPAELQRRFTLLLDALLPDWRDSRYAGNVPSTPYVFSDTWQHQVEQIRARVAYGSSVLIARLSFGEGDFYAIGYYWEFSADSEIVSVKSGSDTSSLRKALERLYSSYRVSGFYFLPPSILEEICDSSSLLEAIA